MRKWNMDELGRKSIAEFKQAGKTPIIVVLDNIRSMHNVGSIFRTADAFLVESIYLCGFTPQPPHRDIHKTALGATETVEWKYFANTIDAVHQLKATGYCVYAVEQAEGSISLENCHFENAKNALIFGNEVEGVNNAVLDASDACIEIPQLGAKHSLNVSVSVGVVLWKLIESSIKK